MFPEQLRDLLSYQSERNAAVHERLSYGLMLAVSGAISVDSGIVSVTGRAALEAAACALTATVY
jgi:hypothetical protein